MNRPTTRASSPSSRRCQTFPAPLGDFIASALNVYVGSWMESAGPSQVELTVLDWFKDWLGYPPEAAGLAAQRRLGGEHDRARLRARGAARPDVRPRGRRTCPTRRTRRWRAPRGCSASGPTRCGCCRPTRTHRLAARDGSPRAIEADAARGASRCSRSPPRGATNTGAVDPLDELAEVCRERGVWLHVDAAYGGFAALTRPRPRARCAGIELADSSRSTRTSGSTSRWSAARCSCATAGCCGARSRSCPTT